MQLQIVLDHTQKHACLPEQDLRCVHCCMRCCMSFLRHSCHACADPTDTYAPTQRHLLPCQLCLPPFLSLSPHLQAARDREGVGIHDALHVGQHEVAPAQAALDDAGGIVDVLDGCQHFQLRVRTCEMTNSWSAAQHMRSCCKYSKVISLLARFNLHVHLQL